tara:strand:- start:1 stop:162 length:162 start_codon:yes stop_codon:yes gene_type:complete
MKMQPAASKHKSDWQKPALQNSALHNVLKKSKCHAALQQSLSLKGWCEAAELS